jgi:hypothetical protein
MGRVGKHLRGNGIAYVALFLALGLGTAYAIERNAVKGKHIAKDAVRSSDIRDGAVGTDDQAEVPSARVFGPVACAPGGEVPANGDAQVGFEGTDFADGVEPQPSDCDAQSDRLRIETPGLYMLTANLVWGQAPGGVRRLQLWRLPGDGDPIVADVQSGSDGLPGQSVTDIQRLDAGDEILIRVSQTSNQAILLADQGALGAVWLGP